MGEALFDLEQILRSKKDNGITSQEANILMLCKAQAVRNFFLGAGGAATAAWFATSRLSNFLRINLSAVAGGAFGLWRSGSSLDSCIDNILSMEGTRIKNELAKIVLTKYKDDPSIMQRISRHFYSENVYDDSSLDRPKLRWRMRNYFADYSDPVRATMHDNSPYNEATAKEKADADQSNLQQKQFPLTTTITMADPFDCIFGVPATIEEINQSDASNMSPRRHSHSKKRSHHRHRKRHQDMSDD